MLPVTHLSLIQVRRLALRSLALELQSHSVSEVIQRLGYVQIDTIAVVERAHHHVLWTRLPTYEVSQLDRAQSAERQILDTGRMLPPTCLWKITASACPAWQPPAAAMPPGSAPTSRSHSMSCSASARKAHGALPISRRSQATVPVPGGTGNRPNSP